MISGYRIVVGFTLGCKPWTPPPSMNSAVYYKFKSQKAESRIPIDGTGISVFDLKREIILANGLDKALDIDLQVFNQLGDEGASRCLYTHCCF